jgi:uncharacterized OB-fold protein
MDLAGLFSIEDGVVRLTGSRCESCGAIAFPARNVCGQCGRRELSPVTLAGRGSVVSSTHVVTPPAGFERPIEVALVDLAEGPRVFALLTAPASPGTTVQAVPAPVREGHPGFAFEPLRGQARAGRTPK